MFTIFTNPEYNKAFYFILPGLRITFLSTVVSFLIAIFLGLVSGIGRISKNRIASTISRTYIEFIRGVPVLILIFTIAFVVVVDVAEFFNINNKLKIWELNGPLAFLFYSRVKPHDSFFSQSESYHI